MTNAPGADAPGRNPAQAIRSPGTRLQLSPPARAARMFRAFGHRAQGTAAADGLWLDQDYALATAPPNHLRNPPAAA
jgi:hypothetical protein